MAKFPLYQWKKAGEGSSSIDTQNFASKIKANTFTQKNTFKNTGDIVSIQRTDNSSFGIDFKDESGERLAFIGTSQNEVGKATVWGVNGLKLQTTNSDIKMISGTADFQWESNRNWNQNIDNTVVRSKDMKWVKIFDLTTTVHQPDNNWDWNSWNWTLTNLNQQAGIYEVLFVVSFADNVPVTIRGEVVWKNGLTESRSQVITAERNQRNYFFQFAIKNDNKLYCYMKHDNAGTGANVGWVRGWIKRGITFPTKLNELW